MGQLIEKYRQGGGGCNAGASTRKALRITKLPLPRRGGNPQREAEHPQPQK